MAYLLQPFESIPLDDALLDLLIEEHETIRRPRLRRLWSYYRNALAEPDERGASRGAPQQAIGLPDRLTHRHGGQRDDRIRREIVIENDIAWRVHTLVDFMFPTAPRLVSTASDPATRRDIETLLGAIIDANGGIALWQDAALLGSVYGSVDFLLNTTGLRATAGRSMHTTPHQHEGSTPGAVPSNPHIDDLAARVGSHLVIETVEAPRAIPLVNGLDYRALDAYIVRTRRPINGVRRDGMLTRLRRAVGTERSRTRGRAWVTTIDIHSATHHQRYENDRLVAEHVNRLGRIPVVHVQNLSQPLAWDGLSDVEPLIPLQDELNTRLSDRANRVTMQSFRMWLGKGIDGFTDRPVGPGQMWVTDNTEASIESFGGDASSPSEAAHLEELREALDKASGVTPAAAGHIKARVGNLTSENALRISLLGTVAKTKRKRVTYGTGICDLASMILHALDVEGVYRTTPGERGVEVVWSDALPIDESRRLADALTKAELGVPKPVLRAELGYDADDEHSNNDDDISAAANGAGR